MAAPLRSPLVAEVSAGERAAVEVAAELLGAALEQATGGDVTVADLVAKGAVRKNEKVKVLGSGDIAVSLNVAVDKVSESAQQKIVAAGGRVD